MFYSIVGEACSSILGAVPMIAVAMVGVVSRGVAHIGVHLPAGMNESLVASNK